MSRVRERCTLALYQVGLGLVLVPILGLCLYIIICLAISVPYHLVNSAKYPLSRDPRADLDMVLEQLRESPKEGWDLVEEAQRLVAARMAYSRRNSWDSYKVAFSRGMGYCVQKAEALKYLLDGLGFNSEIVQSLRNRFRGKQIHEYQSHGGVYGHAWLRVTIGTDSRFVCPGSIENSPGTYQFEILGRVTKYSGIRKWLGNLGSAMMNAIWDVEKK